MDNEKAIEYALDKELEKHNQIIASIKRVFDDKKFIKTINDFSIFLQGIIDYYFRSNAVTGDEALMEVYTDMYYYNGKYCSFSFKINISKEDYDTFMKTYTNTNDFKIPIMTINEFCKISNDNNILDRKIIPAYVDKVISLEEKRNPKLSFYNIDYWTICKA